MSAINDFFTNVRLTDPLTLLYAIMHVPMKEPFILTIRTRSRFLLPGKG